MNNLTDKKSAQLGMPFGTANGRLRKIILFSLVQRCELDTCYRCQQKIIDIDDFTVEHKKAWLDVNPDLFWDLDNIAFSHLDCNVGARRTVNVAFLCFKCKVNPVRRTKTGKPRECKDCNTEAKQSWRLRAGRN